MITIKVKNIDGSIQTLYGEYSSNPHIVTWRTADDSECEKEKITEILSIELGIYDMSLESAFRGMCNLKACCSIPDGVRNCALMFDGCAEFNAPVIIPDSVELCIGMFMFCKKLNQSIKLGRAVEYCDNMFCGCASFNQPFVIPAMVKSCSRMFDGCISMNQQVTVIDCIKDCTNLFGNSTEDKFQIRRTAENNISSFDGNVGAFSKLIRTCETITIPDEETSLFN